MGNQLQANGQSINKMLPTKNQKKYEYNRKSKGTYPQVFQGAQDDRVIRSSSWRGADDGTGELASRGDQPGGLPDCGWHRYDCGQSDGSGKSCQKA